MEGSKRRRSVLLALFCLILLKASRTRAANPTLPRAEALIQPSPSSLPTVTVRGFLNFRTTVDGTVIVFTPSSETPQQKPESPAIEPTKSAQAQTGPTATPASTATTQSVTVATASGATVTASSKSETAAPDKKSSDAQDSAHANKVFGFEIEPDDIEESPASATPSQPTTPSKPSLAVRPPSTTASAKPTTAGTPATPRTTPKPTTTSKATTPKPPTTQKATTKLTTKPATKAAVTTGRPTEKPSTPQPVAAKQPADKKEAVVTRSVDPAAASSALYPTGLVTVLGGTVVSEVGGATTVHETRVIGTYIEGKYAQILESTSRVIPPAAGVQPTPTIAALATAGHSATATTPPSPHPTLQTSTRHDSSAESASTSSGTSRTRGRFGLQSSLRSSSSAAAASGGVRSSHRPTARLLAVSSSEDDHNRIPVTAHHQRGPATSGAQAGHSTRLRYNPLGKSQSVRLNRFKVKLTSRYEDQTALPSELEQLNAFDSQVKALDLDDPLLNIDPAHISWAPTTFTSHVTLRAGQRKSVIRTLTITTSVPVAIEPTELFSNGISDNVIEPTPAFVQSRIYSTEQRTWRTSVVPASHDGFTSMKTITESFVIRKFVTAYRTMPTGDTTEEAANETLSALEDADDSYIRSLLAGGDINATATTRGENSSDEVAAASLNILNGLESALKKNPLAALLLGLNSQQLEPSTQTVTRSSTYVTTETLYNTKVVSFYDGRRTRSKRLSDSVGTTERTLTAYTTEIVTITPAPPSFPFPFLLPPTAAATPSYSTVTSVVTTVTTGTSLSSKIFTLIYNAFSTRYRTVTSTSTYPTTMVITSTASFLVQPTLAAGSLPAPYAHYPPGYPAPPPSPSLPTLAQPQSPTGQQPPAVVAAASGAAAGESVTDATGEPAASAAGAQAAPAAAAAASPSGGAVPAGVN